MIVKNRSDLFRAFDILAREKAIGIDLESDSMFHYKEKVCLIQISVPDKNILIDTLSIRDLEPLSQILSDPAIRKVFHGADYDIRSLFRDFNTEITSLFDTQIAAKFLGIEQTGLSYILENRLGIHLEKKFQKSDWSKRPLSKEMLKYAVKDSCYLLSLAGILEKELMEKGRLSWFEEECELLSKVRPSSPRDEPLFLRFKGAIKLDRRSLALLDELLKLREELASKKDVPPFKILGNNQIMEIVNKKPMTMDDLDGLSLRQIKNLGRSILNRTQVGMNIPEENLPQFPREKKQKLSVIALRKINALKEWKGRYGEEIGIDPSIICPNSLVQAIALVNPCSPEDLKGLSEMRRWQKDLYGDEICTLLSSITQY